MNPIGTDVVTAAGAALVCPGSGMEQIGQAMTGVGLVPNLAGFRVKVEESGIAPGLRTVSCGGDVIQALVDSMGATTTSHTPLLTIYDITGVATLDQVLAERPGLALLQSNVPAIGGDIYGAVCDVATTHTTWPPAAGLDSPLPLRFGACCSRRPTSRRPPSDGSPAMTSR